MALTYTQLRTLISANETPQGGKDKVTSEEIRAVDNAVVDKIEEVEGKIVSASGGDSLTATTQTINTSTTVTEGAPYTVSIGELTTSDATDRKFMLNTNGTGGYIVLGDKALGTTAIGANASATIQRNIAIGVSSISSGNFDAVALGSVAKALHNDTVAIGAYSKASGNSSAALTAYAESKAASCISAGTWSIAHKINCIAIGYHAEAGITDEGAIAIGQFCLAKNYSSIAIGITAEARALYSTAIGYSAIVDTSHTGSIAIGKNISTTAANQIALGGSLKITITQNFADNAAALAGGLLVGDVYRNGDILQIVH